jgi:PhnB protein
MAAALGGHYFDLHPIRQPPVEVAGGWLEVCSMPVKPIPVGAPTIIPSAAVVGCDKAIEYYKKAFGAKEVGRFTAPGGKVMHCELQVGNSRFMLGEAVGMMEPHAFHAMLYVDDCDGVFNQAVRAGATSEQAPADQFWGDRTGRLADPFGNKWYVATHVEDVSDAEMHRRFEAMVAEKAAE